MDKMESLLNNYPELEGQKENILAALNVLCEMCANGGKLLLCGNGGSCADCDHIVGELMKGFLLPRPIEDKLKTEIEKVAGENAEIFAKGLQRGVPAISLCSQTALLTAYNNDVNPELIYAQLLLGLAKPGDVLFAISTSGNSKNVVRAAQLAKALGIKVISLTGEKACKLDALSDAIIKAPASETYRVQEYHLPIYHFLCAKLEEELFG